MKIAAIAKVIKDRGSCHIVRIHGAEDTETSMFIGTGSELYSLGSLSRGQKRRL